MKIYNVILFAKFGAKEQKLVVPILVKFMIAGIAFPSP